MPTILLIRHGESQSNAGLPTSRTEDIALTDKGNEQARQIARYLEDFQITPELIVISPYLRAIQTAAPTTLSFPSVPTTDTWPVQEFNYLSSWINTNSTVQDRHQYVEEYWTLSDPKYVDSSGSETFQQFIHRVAEVMHRLKKTRQNPIAIFSHQQFICALLWLSQQGRLSLSSDTMRNFKEFLASYPIPNGGIVPVHFEDCNDKWHIGPIITSHLNNIEPVMARE